MLMSKDKIYAFSFENTKVLTCYHTCIRITYTVQTGSLYFVELFEKGSGIHKKRRCFYLCVMSNAFIFDGFLSMGEICFFVFISKNRGVVKLMSYSFRSVGTKFCLEFLRELIVEKVWM